MFQFLPDRVQFGFEGDICNSRAVRGGTQPGAGGRQSGQRIGGGMRLLLCRLRLVFGKFSADAPGVERLDMHAEPDQRQRRYHAADHPRPPDCTCAHASARNPGLVPRASMVSTWARGRLANEICTHASNSYNNWSNAMLDCWMACATASGEP